VCIRFAWEPNIGDLENGLWSPCDGASTAQDYINMWRHVHDIFTNAYGLDSTRVAWVYSVSDGDAFGGDSTFTDGTATYNTWSGYRTAIDTGFRQGWIATTDPADPRLLTDQQFSAG
jgi:beta-mannanase